MCRFSVTPVVASPQRFNTNFNTYVNELEENIEYLEHEIKESCDQIIKLAEQRRNRLLEAVREIREEKLKTLQKGNPLILESTDLNVRFGNDAYLGNCLRFVTDNKILDMIEEHGIIDEGRASAENSKASGIALKYGVTNESNQFVLQTYNNSNELSWVEQDKIEVVIKKGEEIFPCIIQNHCNGSYGIFYELQEAGLYEIHIQVNGRHITKSPFMCDILELCHLKFSDSEDTPELTFQDFDKSVLVQKTDIQRSSKIYSHIDPAEKAWKVRVTTACPKIKLKFGYTNAASCIPELQEEFYCKFNLSDLITNQVSHQSAHHTRNHKRRSHERKQSIYKQSSLTFVIFQDSFNKEIHAVVEGTHHEQTTAFHELYGDELVPFIGIKHFCKNESCPRPKLVFL